MQNVGRKMAKGAAWMVLFKLFERALGLISTLILARLLVPADFGLVAMATAFAAVLDVLTSFSFDLALIQRQDAERRHYDTAWTFNLIAAVVIAAVMLLGADLVAAYFREPAVKSVVEFLSLCFLVQGFQNIGVVAFQKELQLHKEFALGITRKLVQVVAAVALALWLGNYWALLWSMLIGRATGVLLSYAMHPYRPRFSFAGAPELLHFSKWVFLSNILVFTNYKIADFVIGRSAGAAALGGYGVAYELSNLPTTELVHPISRAVFPGYARIAADGNALRTSYFDVLSIVALIAVPIGLGICALAGPLVGVLLGSHWIEIVPLVEVLSIFGVIRALAANSGAAFIALGRPNAIAALAGLNLAVLVPLLVLGTQRHGAIGAALAVLAAAAVQVPIGFTWLIRMMQASAAQMARTLWRPLVAGAIMYMAVAALGRATPLVESNGITQLAVLVPAGALIYLFLVLTFWRMSGAVRAGEEIVLDFLQEKYRSIFRST